MAPNCNRKEQQRCWIRRLATQVCVLVLISAIGTASAAADTPEIVRCQEHWLRGSIPATLMPLSASGTLPYRVVGELCTSSDYRARGSTVQLLIHGATYNHSYWDFGTVDGVRYSYARDMAARGFATFAVDQLGSGQSSKPPSADVTNQVEAYIDHELVQGLRNGSLTGIRFGHVIEVGHSLGSLSVWQEAITYQDVNGVVITGMAHHFTTTADDDSAGDFYPAGSDPKFQGQPWAANDPGYVTTVPGTRASFFYNTADADPKVIAADDNEIPFNDETFWNERGKDVASRGTSDGVPLIYSPATQAIHVPVLVVLGSKDAVVCGEDATGVDFSCSSGAVIAEEEQPYYSPQAHLEACSVPGAGHDISLHLNFRIQEEAVRAWADHFFGMGSQHGPDRLPAVCGFQGPARLAEHRSSSGLIPAAPARRLRVPHEVARRQLTGPRPACAAGI